MQLLKLMAKIYFYWQGKIFITFNQKSKQGSSILCRLKVNCILVWFKSCYLREIDENIHNILRYYIYLCSSIQRRAWNIRAMHQVLLYRLVFCLLFDWLFCPCVCVHVCLCLVRSVYSKRTWILSKTNIESIFLM